MKKLENITTLFIALFGTLLFYKESVGINILVFTLVSIVGFLILNKRNHILKLIFSIFPPILCSLILAIYPQALTYLIWFLSYLIMWSNVEKVNYPLTIPLKAMFGILESPFELIKKNLLREKINKEKEKSGQGLIYMVSGVIVVSFLWLYVKSNPVFSNLFYKINLSFIEIGFILTLLGLYLIVYGLTAKKSYKKIQQLNTLKQTIQKCELKEREELEFKIAKLSIWMVTCLLLLTNLIDLGVIIIGKLPEGMTYAEYVHQGFYTLIFTLSLAIGLIIYFFRGQINFHHKIQPLQTASIFWIFQNILLALLTGYKNFLYVEVYGLTYKRIAVFLGLLCVIIGLILSLKKIKMPFTNWFFFNRLSFYAYICAILISFIPFDSIITRYNLTYSQTIDLDYLLRLDKPDLLMMKNFVDRSGNKYKVFNSTISKKILSLSIKANKINWQSWNLYLNTYKDNELR